MNKRVIDSLPDPSGDMLDSLPEPHRPYYLAHFEPIAQVPQPEADSSFATRRPTTPIGGVTSSHHAFRSSCRSARAGSPTSRRGAAAASPAAEQARAALGVAAVKSSR